MVTPHTHTVTPVTLSFTEEIASGIFLIGFRRNFSFTAGQVIGIGLEEHGPRRLYSICSGEEEEEVRILYNVIEEGFLTPRLSGCMEGDTLWITEPRGQFLGKPDPAVWIASGTGIAPFYSMLRSGYGEDKILIHGDRYLDQFHFYDEFLEILHERYIRCCSGEDSEEVFHGRVTHFLQQLEEVNPALKYYLCGSAEMVVETRDILIARGVPFDHILSEIYF